MTRLRALALTLGGLTAWLVARRARRADLRGRVAVVTGGGRGLGFAVARELRRRGCRLAICGRDGEVVARAAQALGADVFAAACDASDPAEVEGFVAEVINRFGRIDVLVNNAGQCFVGPAVELQQGDVEYALRNLFWVHWHPTMAIVPHMRLRGFGRIVNVTSIGGKLPIPHQAAYSAGKYAATGWSEVLAIELQRHGIFVSTVTPPALDDGAPLHAHFHGREEGEFRWFANMLTSPWSAISTERAARAIVDAAEYGDAARAVSLGAWLATRAHGLAPGLTTRLLARVDRLMPPPAPPGQSSSMRLGAEVVADSTDSRIHALGKRSAVLERRQRP
jgi:NAD(P)-dependent dehydrogenase (short-subunit alcohol dehydrogenase family)